jgi:integrase
MHQIQIFTADQAAWNKGKLVGQKPPLKQREVWAIRARLELDNRIRDLALFNLAIDSKLRGCDLVTLRLGDVTHGEQIALRAVQLLLGHTKSESTVRYLGIEVEDALEIAEQTEI